LNAFIDCNLYPTFSHLFYTLFNFSIPCIVGVIHYQHSIQRTSVCHDQQTSTWVIC